MRISKGVKDPVTVTALALRGLDMRQETGRWVVNAVDDVLPLAGKEWMISICAHSVANKSIVVFFYFKKA